MAITTTNDYCDFCGEWARLLWLVKLVDAYEGWACELCKHDLKKHGLLEDATNGET